MGLIKIRNKIPVDNIIDLKQTNSIPDELEEEENNFGPESGDDSDTGEFPETGCEFCMVGDQVCCIPYEIYSLPDLKEILSLETWNLCLTDEERFSLTAYLPDMDQLTFWLTLKELLTGKEMFFGSPLKEIFERLKGGFYPPKVSQFREGLMFLQRRVFYHSLRSYHENMGRTFSDMEKIWSKCQPNVTVERRIQIWNSLKKEKGMDGLDLNAFPGDLKPESKLRDITFSTAEKNSFISVPVAKMMNLPPVSVGTSLLPLKNNAKGVLKIKPVGPNSLQTGLTCRPPPKGVLKILPRGSCTLSCANTSSSMLVPQSSRWETDNSYYEEKSFANQTDRNRKPYRTPQELKSSIDQEQAAYHNNTTISGENVLSYVRKTKRSKEIKVTNDLRKPHLFLGACQIEGRSGVENVELRDHSGQHSFHKLGQQKSEHPERKMTSMSLYPGNHDAVLRISGAGNGAHHQTLAASFSQTKERNKDVYGMGLEKPMYDGTSNLRGIRDSSKLPITYKRRKASTKANPLVDFVKVSTVGIDLESKTSFQERNEHLGDNPKAARIKLKNWRDPESLHQNGLLNVLQQGSPSMLSASAINLLYVCKCASISKLGWNSVNSLDLTIRRPFQPIPADDYTPINLAK